MKQTRKLLFPGLSPLKIKKQLCISVLLTILVGINLYWTWQNYPAIMSLDSVHTWGEINGLRPLNDHHTSAWNIYSFLLSIGGNYLFTLPVFQQTFLLITLYIFMKALDPEGGVELRIFYLILLSFTPYLSMFPLTWWKDIPYSTITLLGLSVLAIAHKSNIGAKKYFIISFFLLSISFTFRHNGIYVGALSLLLLILSTVITKSFCKRKLKLSLFVFALSLILGYLLLNSLPKIIGAQEIPKNTAYQGFLHEIIVVASSPGAKVPPTASKFINRTTKNLLSPEYLTCNPSIFSDTVMPTLLISDLDYTFLNSNYNEIIPVWYSLLKLNPEIIVNNRLCRFSNLIPPPFSKMPTNIYWFHEGIEKNDYGLSYAPTYDAFRVPFVAMKEFWRWNENFTAWPGLQLLLIVLICSRRLLQSKDVFKFGLILSFCISSTLILILASPGPDARYLYLNSLIFISVFIMEIGSQSKRIWRRIRDLNP